MKVLITGGAGFIGSYLAKFLLKKEGQIFVIDNLHPQVHGNDKYNSYLYKSIIDSVEFIEEDISSSSTLNKLVSKVDYIVHLAAETATGQSMYNIHNVVKTNSLGTANILESVVKSKKTIKKFILASSTTVYGEGKYLCSVHGIVYPQRRSLSDIQKGDFECKCPVCNNLIVSLPTDEESILSPRSIYGVTKENQETLVRTLCNSIDLPYTIFRFHNVYGKGQSINNPYTGIISIFSKLIMEEVGIKVFEDGLESRDFIHVGDIVRAIYLDMGSNIKNQTYNLGTGIRTSVINIIQLLEKVTNQTSKYSIQGSHRIGDIRHICADLNKISRNLGFKPSIKLEDGIKETAEWIKTLQNISQPLNYNSSFNEMKNFKMYFEKK